MFIPIKSLTHFALAGVSLMCSLSVAAQDKAGLYVTAYGGSSKLASTNFTESRTAMATLNGKGDFGGGTGLGGAIGQRYGNGWAAELAWDYRSHKLNSIGGVPVTGDFASTTAFLNGYYRFQKMGMVRPFVGAGLGYVTELDIDLGRGGSEQQYSRRGGLATQVIVGGEVDLSDRWSVSADLRWSNMGSRSFKSANAGSALGGTPKYQPASFNLGLTYRF
jgi:outer membrane protein W